MKTVDDLQGLIQFHLRDLTGSFIVTSDPGLSWLNFVYRKMSTISDWPELTVTSPTWIKTVAGTNTYAVPFDPDYVDIRLVELQDPDDNNKYKRVPPTRSELLWSMADRKPNGFPEQHQFHDGDGSGYALSFEVRPAPLFSGAYFRVTGSIEPDDLYTTPSAIDSTTGAAPNTTVWRSDTQDDLLAMLTAAYIAAQRGAMPYASHLFNQAAMLMTALTDTRVTPSEFRELLGLQPGMDAA